MRKSFGILLVLAALLLAAPVIESGTSESQVFQAVGTADGGGGGL